MTTCGNYVAAPKAFKFDTRCATCSKSHATHLVEQVAALQAARYARCPGCGDRGDARHIAACVPLRMIRRDENIMLVAATRYAVRMAVRELLGAVRTQVGRRGRVDIGALAEMLVNRWGA